MTLEDVINKGTIQHVKENGKLAGNFESDLAEYIRTHYAEQG